MALELFVAQLVELGFEVQQPASDRVMLDYTIPIGRLTGTKVRLGFVVPGDFPLTPPSGPHISPHLLQINQNSGAHPNAGVHLSDIGPDWQYWSRPFPEWGRSTKSARVYMAHIRHLFETL